MTQTNCINSEPKKTCCEGGVLMLYCLPVIVPIICYAIEKVAFITHDAMEHGYNLSVNVGSVDISLTNSCDAQ